MTDPVLPASLAVLGSTGSVGVQALDVARLHHIPVRLLTGNRNVALMERQAREFLPDAVVMADPAAARDLARRLIDTHIRVSGGEEALCAEIRVAAADVTVNAILGEAGLAPTLAAVSCGKRLALSNKESLVIAGAIVMQAARDHGCEIIPVDSEHSAIYQCLRASRPRDVKRLWLTASGGPFFGRTPAELAQVTLADTLAHPTWKMGRKITVDSATMMNKGFEIIEAVHLFAVPEDRIRVLVHRESIIHSAVEYIDNAVICQMAVPDMRLCVAYALATPARLPGGCEELDLCRLGRLTFAEPDTDAFPLLEEARAAIRVGGASPAVLNAANESAVAAFLAGRISFCDISRIVCETHRAFSGTAGKAVTLPQILECAAAARRHADSLIEKVD